MYKIIESKENPYVMLLNEFKCKDSVAYWLNEPFIAGDRCAASNGYALVSTPLVDGEFENRTEKLKYVYPIVHNMSKKISVSELRNTISKVPMVEVLDEEEVECDVCDGTGEVEYEFYHKKMYYMEGVCPACDGMGVIEKKSTKSSGLKMKDDVFIRIGVSLFYPDRIKEIITAATIMQAREVELVHQREATTPSLFKIKDVELMVMPAGVNDEHDVIAEVTLEP